MRILETLRRPVMAAAFCGLALWGGNVSAEQTGMEAFKEALTMSPVNDTRVFREQITFFLPQLKADLDFQAASQKESDLKVQGELTFIATDDKGNTVKTKW